MKTIDHATEITRLESDRDALDQTWRRIRHASVSTPEERHARDTELAGIEVAYRETEMQLARLHVESCDHRLAAIDDVDPDALAQAEAEYLAAKVAYDELRHQEHGVYVRRRDAEADLKIARRTLGEAEYAVEQRRQRHADVASHPVRAPMPAAQWIGDGQGNG